MLFLAPVALTANPPCLEAKITAESPLRHRPSSIGREILNRTDGRPFTRTHSFIFVRVAVQRGSSRENLLPQKMSKRHSAIFFKTAGNETAKVTLKHATGPVPQAPKMSQ
jgi:hypothetical protein